MLPDNPIKQLFQRDNLWDQILAEPGDNLRPAVIENVEKMLNCATSMMGSRLYVCSNRCCSHTKYIHQTCKGRACPSCGKKATEQWIAKQSGIMPDCKWQHITFTLPDVLWFVFSLNRKLLGALFQCAASILQNWAKKKGCQIGIFCALHTYGRQFNWNVHIHLSVTCGGLTDTGQWKPLYFPAKTIERCWRANVITLLKKQHPDLVLPTEHQSPFDWYNFLDLQYQRHWHIHLAKTTKNAKRTVNYLGRYLKKLPLSASRLRHYKKGETLDVNYLDHRTHEHKQLTIEPKALILRLIEHIPDKHFRMIRYFGFLANANRKNQLPKVYKALNQRQPEPIVLITYRMLSKGYLRVDPFVCILCGSELRYSQFRLGAKIAALIERRKARQKRRQ